MTHLKLTDLSLSYPNFKLEQVSFQLNAGEKVSVLGASGCGKSTLLSAIYGLLNLESGDLQFKGEEVMGPDKVLIPGHKEMRLVNQNYALDNYHTVRENISNKILHFEKGEIENRTEEILEVINLKDVESNIAVNLSGGQKQRLALGRALVELPELLLLDEPFSQIDLMNKVTIESKLLEFLKEKDVSVIMVTHDFHDAFALSGRILILKDGKVVRDTNKEALYENPNSHYEAMLTGGYNRLDKSKLKLDFRKNEFSLLPSSKYHVEVKVRVVDILNLGSKFLYSCLTFEDENIQLESSFKLNTFDKIYLIDKRYPFEN